MTPELSEQYDKIYRYCYLRTHDKSLAEDLTQETFLRYYRALDLEGKVPEKKPLPYLYTIAGNLCVDHYRRSARAPVLTGDWPEIADERSDPGKLSERLAVREAVQTLPADLQELVILRFVEELSAAVSVVVELNRSLIYGMSEIEMGARYNLTEVYYARTLLLGVGNLLLILIVLPFVARESQVTIIQMVIYLLTPYLFTVTLALEIAGRCGRESLQLAAAASAVLVSAVYLLLVNRLNLYGGVYTGFWTLAFLMMICTAFREWRNTKKNLEARICN